ncbi:hypothetical protein LJC42_07010 [Eubacteriales bacterium OttesenSCG-928-K08]|nr:hypothetical protein [Eubacteriales bacterium OttesenSCG-928-K08]
MGIVDRIRERLPKGESLASLEKRFGYSSSYIRKWDDALPSADRLYQVASFLSVSMEYLLIGEEISDVNLSNSDSNLRKLTDIYINLPEDERILLVAEAVKIQKTVKQTVQTPINKQNKLA